MNRVGYPNYILAPGLVILPWCCLFSPQIGFRGENAAAEQSTSTYLIASFALRCTAN